MTVRRAEKKHNPRCPKLGSVHDQPRLGDTRGLALWHSNGQGDRTGAACVWNLRKHQSMACDQRRPRLCGLCDGGRLARDGGAISIGVVILGGTDAANYTRVQDGHNGGRHGRLASGSVQARDALGLAGRDLARSGTRPGVKGGTLQALVPAVCCCDPWQLIAQSAGRDT